jgi:hypothetical protein
MAEVLDSSANFIPLCSIAIFRAFRARALFTAGLICMDVLRMVPLLGWMDPLIAVMGIPPRRLVLMLNPSALNPKALIMITFSSTVAGVAMLLMQQRC